MCTQVVCIGLYKPLLEAGNTPSKDKGKDKTSALLVVTSSHTLCFHNLEQVMCC
jgi:hypothetical protein